MGRLMRLSRPYRLHLATILGLNLLQTPLTLLAPVPIKIVVDSVLGSHPLPGGLAWAIPRGLEASANAKLTLAVGLIIVVTLLTYGGSLASWWLQTFTGENLMLEFRRKLFGHVQRLSLSYHDTQGTTDSTYRIQYDADSIQTVTINGAIPLLNSAFTVVSMVMVTAFLDLKLSLIALSVCPVLYAVILRYRHLIRDRWRVVKQYDSSAMNVVQEVLSSLRVVKAFGREEDEQARFSRQADKRVENQIRLAALHGQFDLFVGLTIAVGSASVLLVGVHDVRSGYLTLGSLLVVLSYLTQLYEPLRAISTKLTDLQAGLTGAERAFKLLDELPEVIDHPGAKRLRKASGAVAFENVRFSYEPARPVLKDISFEAPPGAKVGIQGRTGAGKSTLMTLLMRFYDPESGRILLDGVDLRDYRVADLRSQFGLVLQDPVLFSTSLAENIGYGKPGATQDEIMEAARRANAHDFISALPDGYETQVGERGMKLSGGERQRISLARAFLRDAPILILDEPTSSVDLKTEQAILEALERLMEGRTTFIIAHRLSTLEGCDLRLEMEQGRLTVQTQRRCPA